MTHRAPRRLPVFSTSLITFNTPSNLSVKRVPTEHERWAFAIGRLRPLLTLVNGHPELLVGSIRRESLDHLIVFGEVHLRGVLKAYASYYNEVRTHLSLDKDAPDFRRAQKLGRIAARPILGGLHHQYVRV